MRLASPRLGIGVELQILPRFLCGEHRLRDAAGALAASELQKDTLCNLQYVLPGNVHTYTRIDIHIYICIYVYTHTKHTRRYMYIHTYMYIYVYNVYL